jgi:hypothetical protein
MVQRAEAAGEIPNEQFVANVHERLAALEVAAAAQEITMDELDELGRDAQYQGQLEAYICPQREIAIEGRLCLDELEEWNVPRSIIARLRALLIPKLEQADADPATAS